jgi:hypothetical protein
VSHSPDGLAKHAPAHIAPRNPAEIALEAQVLLTPWRVVATLQEDAFRGGVVEIGKPQRTITVEPVEDPVPRERPEKQPEPKPREPEKVPG